MGVNNGETINNNKLGRWGATSFIAGNIVGAGIFVAPTAISNQVHSVGMSLTIWLLSGAICTLGGYCYLELGTSINRSGGDFAYLCFVKWRPIAFAFMVTGCVLVYPMQTAIAAEAAGQYAVQGLGLPADIGHVFWLRKLIGFSIVWLIMFLNFFSVRRVVAPFQMASSVAKLFACGLIIAVGAYLLIVQGHTENFQDPFANSSYAPAHIANALFAGFYSYDGFDILNWGAEEVHNPRSTMSFAMFAGMSCVASVYTAMNVAYFTVLGPEQMRTSGAVAMSFAEQIVGPRTAQWTIPLLINLVMLGSINGTMFIASRYLFAAARERQLPTFLACIHEKHESPRVALFTHVLLAFAFSFFGSTDQLLVAMGFAQWFQRFFTISALLFIRLRSVPVPALRPLRTPLLVPLFFWSICLALILITLIQEFSNALISVAVLAFASLLYALFIWDQTLQRWKGYSDAIQKINDGLSKLAQITFGGRIDIIHDD